MEDWELSKMVSDQSKIKWAISTFIPFKSAGTDVIVLALLQQEVNHLTTHQCRVFRTCLGRPNYTEAKEYRLISLTSFMLKTMEKLVCRHIRDEILGLHHLHQFAHQPKKSTETALHHVITYIKEEVKNTEVTLGAFLNI